MYRKLITFDVINFSPFVKPDFYKLRNISDFKKVDEVDTNTPWHLSKETEVPLKRRN